MKLQEYKLVAAQGMVGHKVAVKIHNRLYCSPAVKLLIQEADASDLRLLEACLPIISMEDSPYFMYSQQHKEIASLAAEGEC